MGFLNSGLSVVNGCNFHPKGHIHSSDAEGSKTRKGLWVDLNVGSENSHSVAVIGINPSTASEKASDNTLTKVSRTMHSLGFERLYMLNLFESRSVKQDEIDRNTVTDFCSNENAEILNNVDAIIIAWGINGYDLEKENALKILYKYSNKLFCISKNGKYPYHPRVWAYNDDYKIVKFLITTK